MEKYEVYENEPVMFHNRAFSLSEQDAWIWRFTKNI